MTRKKTPKYLSDDEVSVRLATREAQFASRRAWADHLGVSSAFLTQVMRGQKQPSPRILTDVGLERVEVVRMAER